jgi:glutathione synthase/RimK-type ligase-like ATP-grasp enzyme
VNLGLAVSAATREGVPDTAVLLDAARAQGVGARVIDWRADGWDWPDVVLLHTPWDYTQHPQAFSAWLRALSAGTRVANPYTAVAANLHKSYLLDLAADGVPIPRTRLLRAGRPVDTDALRAAFGDTAVVVKPAVGAGGRGLRRLDRVDDLGSLPVEDLLVQEFVPSVHALGEHSLVFVAGRASHLVRKLPAAGEFRVQASHGGTEQRVELDDVAAGLAEVLRTRVGDLAYARLDYVLGRDGEPLVMELELTEPDLFLRHCPDAARALVAHLAGS